MCEFHLRLSWITTPSSLNSVSLSITVSLMHKWGGLSLCFLKEEHMSFVYLALISILFYHLVFFHLIFHLTSNIPANPAYGVYISQLVRYARIRTSKVDFMNRLRGLSLRLRQQGFLTNLLQRTFTKFFNRHCLIVGKYGATLRETIFAIQP